MILKTNDTQKGNVSMSLGIDWENREITVDVQYWNKKDNSVTGWSYEAQDFNSAIEKFDEISKLIA